MAVQVTLRDIEFIFIISKFPGRYFVKELFPFFRSNKRISVDTQDQGVKTYSREKARETLYFSDDCSFLNWEILR